jgi:hypothetical protein
MQDQDTLVLMACPPAAPGSVVGPIAGNNDSKILVCDCCDHAKIIGPVNADGAKCICGSCAAECVRLSMQSMLGASADNPFGEVKPLVVPDAEVREREGMTCIGVSPEQFERIDGVKREDMIVEPCTRCGGEVARHRLTPVPKKPRIVCMDCYGGIGAMLAAAARGRARVSETGRDLAAAAGQTKH